ncbi:SRPBCC domain-containing protein [Amycolatopsis sp. PS_44_ISF1]|uniref:SRPBCC domain-containing protein n=1 Tax=Amycolatopsis sp. PS_44_ISF1 TaxID=2974917 RepID=UPI0028E09D58|nr:SRPBCC domain-containing protein [Amycolatopsis sp. PS_44_ISF1]MDT8915029.1 SRPBCC domain-containing protein [Amycolatopsis sp. PS_44_ISF1]
MKTEFSLPDETRIRYTRAFDASPKRIWAAYTTPDVVRTWMTGPHPGTLFEVCEMDIRPGGTYRWVWQYPQGRLEIRGDVQVAEEPHRLVTTEQMSDLDLPPTRHEITFEARGDRTVMTGTITYSSPEARDAAYASGMGTGMDAGFDRLEEAA